MCRSIIFSLLTALVVAAATQPALAERVWAEVRWTSSGVPHVVADDYQGLGLGYGYAVARNRLCVLADRMMTLRAERSRWHGPEGRTLVGFVPASNLDADLFHKIHLSTEMVIKAERALSSESRALALGYAQGFNRYVAELDAEYRESVCDGAPLLTMTRHDVVRAMMAIGTIWKASRIAPCMAASAWDAPGCSNGPSDVEQAYRPLTGASNVWAYGGDVTDSGAAIVVANPHTFWQGEHWLLMHQLRLTIAGEIDVAGADFVGLPFPVVGFNRDLAWSLQAPSTVRYYVLQAMIVEIGESPAYMVDGERAPLRIKHVPIDIRQPTGNVVRKWFPFAWSELGPVYRLPEARSQPAGWYTITDAGEGNARGLDQLLGIARAQDIAEFTRLVTSHRGIGSHLIAGDRHGMTAYVEGGPLLDISDELLAECRLPGEGIAVDVLDGSRSECAIREPSGMPKLVSPDGLPAIMDRGVIHNTNNSYHHSVYGQKLPGYSRLLGREDDHDLRLPMSQKRIAEVLERGPVTARAALDVMLDNRNLAAETWLDQILRVCPAMKTRKGLKGCVTLQKWNRRNDKHSRGALLFGQLWTELAHRQPFAAPWSWNQIQAAENIDLSDEDLDGVAELLEYSIERLAKSGLAGDEPWGRILARQTPAGRYPLHGGSAAEGVLNVIRGGELGPDGFEDIVSGTSYLQLVQWTDGVVEARVLLAHGQSSDPTSPHFVDQLRPFADKSLMPFAFPDDEQIIETLRIEH